MYIYSVSLSRCSFFIYYYSIAIEASNLRFKTIAMYFGLAFLTRLSGIVPIALSVPISAESSDAGVFKYIYI